MNAFYISIIREHDNKSLQELIALEALKLELLKDSISVDDMEFGRVVIFKCLGIPSAMIANIKFSSETIERARKIIALKLSEYQYFPLEDLEMKIITVLYQNEQIFTFNMSLCDNDKIFQILECWWCNNTIAFAVDDSKHTEIVFSNVLNAPTTNLCNNCRREFLFPPVSPGFSYGLVSIAPSIIEKNCPTLQMYAMHLSRFICNKDQFIQYRPLLGGGYFGILGTCSSTDLKSSYSQARTVLNITDVSKKEFDESFYTVNSYIKQMATNDLFLAQIILLTYISYGNTDYNSFIECFSNVHYNDFVELINEQSRKAPTFIVAGLMTRNCLDKVMEG